MSKLDRALLIAAFVALGLAVLMGPVALMEVLVWGPQKPPVALEGHLDPNRTGIAVLAR